MNRIGAIFVPYGSPMSISIFSRPSTVTLQLLRSIFIISIVLLLAYSVSRFCTTVSCSGLLKAPSRSQYIAKVPFLFSWWFLICIAVVITKFICVEHPCLNPVYRFQLIYASIKTCNSGVIRLSSILKIIDTAVIGLVY